MINCGDNRGIQIALATLWSLVLLPLCLAVAQTAVAVATPTIGAYAVSATSAEAAGNPGAAAFASIIPVDESIEWQIVVPESYDPERPPGVLVYISPSESGKLPQQWRRLPESHNFIWVAADDSGNQRSVARRIAYAVFAVGLIDKRYDIDTERVFLSGFSGGARVAGLVAAAYPQMFRGGIYMGGAEMWDIEPTPDTLEAIRENRFVFITGTEDFNRPMALKVAAQYANAGIKKQKTIVISRHGHELPPSRRMRDALNFLDGVSPD